MSLVLPKCTTESRSSSDIAKAKRWSHKCGSLLEPPPDIPLTGESHAPHLHHSVHHDRGAERPGARKDEDLAELSAIENIQGVRLDVNKQEQIDAAVKTISKAGRGLYGLVNNAGVVVVQPLMEIDEQDFDFQMNADISDLGTVLHDQICHGSLCRRAG